MQFQCATGGSKMAGLSRTGASGSMFKQVTYGFFCFTNAERAYLVNYGGFGSGGGNSWNTGLTPVSNFLNGATYSASDVFSMEIVGRTMQVSLHWMHARACRHSVSLLPTRHRTIPSVPPRHSPTTLCALCSGR